MKEIKTLKEFVVNCPLYKYIQDNLMLNSIVEGNAYTTIDLNKNTKEFYTIYFHCHGHAFEDQDKIRKLLKRALGIGRKYLKYEAPYELEYRLTPEKYDEVNVFLKMLGY